MTEQAVVQWVTDYGYFGIFFLLIFGIIGLPVPDEWLLVISGYLAFKNVLGFVPTVAVAVLGSAGGLTMSYVLGRTSSGYMVRRYGHWLSIDDEKIRSTEHWFQNLGRWVLVVGPFVPGVRNLMGLYRRCIQCKNGSTARAFPIAPWELKRSHDKSYEDDEPAGGSRPRASAGARRFQTHPGQLLLRHGVPAGCESRRFLLFAVPAFYGFSRTNPSPCGW